MALPAFSDALDGSYHDASLVDLGSDERQLDHWVRDVNQRVRALRAVAGLSRTERAKPRHALRCMGQLRSGGVGAR